MVYKAMKKALITGITGQDGSYLAEFLLAKGYEVHGLIRRSSSFNTSRIDHIYTEPNTFNQTFFLHHGDLTDTSGIMSLLIKIQPDEIYHLGAQSHVRTSFDIPVFTADVTGSSTIKILESIRQLGLKSKFYQASSSEMFGLAPAPQNEMTPFHPRSPYGCAKVFAYWSAVNYRESYGMFIANGILFNHESPRRGETFVTRKITKGISKIKAGLQDSIYLGNLDAVRDWGYAKEYVEAMWLMLQQDEPDDYVIATGVGVTVKDFAQEAFSYAGLDWEKYIKFDERYLRPAEVNSLIGDYSKAKNVLNWEPKISVKELAHLMVDSDINLLDKTLQ
jgi:GDPmannose 4,6-dehydratase